MKFCQAIARLWAATAVLGGLAFGFLGFAPWAPLDGALFAGPRTTIVAGYFIGGIVIALSDFLDCYFGGNKPSAHKT